LLSNIESKIIFYFITIITMILCLIGIGDASHAAHHTKNVVVGSIDTHLGGGSSCNSSGGENKLEDCIVNAGEVA